MSSIGRATYASLILSLVFIRLASRTPAPALAANVSSCTADPSGATVVANSSICGVDVAANPSSLGGTDTWLTAANTWQYLGVGITFDLASSSAITATFSGTAADNTGNCEMRVGLTVDGGSYPIAWQEVSLTQSYDGSINLSAVLSLASGTSHTHQLVGEYTSASTTCTDSITRLRISPYGEGLALMAVEYSNSAVTAVPVVRFSVRHVGTQARFVWSTSMRGSILGFNVYAHTKRLNYKRIGTNRSNHYHFTTRRALHGPYALQVLMRNGSATMVSVR